MRYVPTGEPGRIQRAYPRIRPENGRATGARSMTAFRSLRRRRP